MNQINLNYSVLMSVYYKEKAENLKQSMNSIYTQSKKTNDFVLVCDGELTKELYDVISEERSKFGDILKVIQLDKNVGLGKALNIGLKECKNELVARMDSDDISLKNRCELQLNVFVTQNVDIVSGTIEEFSDDKVGMKRVLPENNDGIIKFSKKRCPFNHPCVMYKKTSVINAGNYQDFYHMEDYYLWIRMLNEGYKGYNIQEIILKMRAGNEMYKRRAGFKYAFTSMKIFKYMKKIGYINKISCFNSCLLRLIVALMPNCIRKILYNKKLRKK